MSKQAISQLVSVAVLGLLILFFSLMLVVIASPLFVPRSIGTGGFAFAISRRAFTGALVALLTVFAAVLFLFARARRRRPLN